MDITSIFATQEPDSEEEVFVTKNIFTSTPAARTQRKRKRSPAKSSPRKTRLRSKMARDNNNGSESSASEDSESSDVSKIAAQIAKMNEKMDKMENNIVDSVAVAVAPLSIKLDSTNKRIDEMEVKHAREIEKINARLSAEMQKAINAKIAELSSATASAASGGSSSYASAAAAAATSASAAAAAPKTVTPGNLPLDRRSDEWYWSSRKCLRFFPIVGKTENQMRTSLDLFFTEKLKIPTGTLSPTDIGFVRRVKSAKRAKIKDEAMVSFNSVNARDTVQSYARNLSEWVSDKNVPLAGIRMEIPEKLMGCLLYTSPSPRDLSTSRMPSSA